MPPPAVKKAEVIMRLLRWNNEAYALTYSTELKVVSECVFKKNRMHGLIRMDCAIKSLFCTLQFKVYLLDKVPPSVNNIQPSIFTFFSGVNMRKFIEISGKWVQQI